MAASIPVLIPTFREVRSPYAPVVPVAAAAACPDVVTLGGGSPPAPPSPEGCRLHSWQKLALVGLACAGAVGGIVAGLAPPIPPPPAISLSALRGNQALPVLRDGMPSFRLPDAAPRSRAATSMAAMRGQVRHLGFLPLDPFVASVASDVWARQQGRVKDTYHFLSMPGWFQDSSLPVALGFENGPKAPMLVILPGIGSGTRASKVEALKHMALAHGMNFTVVPNPFSTEWQFSHPAHDPGNPRWESDALYHVLRELKAKYPEYYRHVSVTGYSYGGMLAAGVLQAQTGREPVVNGSMVALSPPEQLDHSMGQLDHLRDTYAGKPQGSYLLTALDYQDDMQQYGYRHFMKSPEAHKKSDMTERMMVDQFGSRFPFQDVLSYIDEYRGYNELPLNHREAENRYPIRHWQQLGDAQDRITMNETYKDYTHRLLPRDPWFAAHHTTPLAVARSYRYSDLMRKVSGRGVPVLTLTSADDDILTPGDRADFRQMQAHPAPDQVTRVLPAGGHTGALFSPDVRRDMMEFLKTPPGGAGS